jgi:hypothetical protein
MIIELNKSNEYWENKEDDDIRSYNANDLRTRYLRDKRAYLDNDDDDDEINEIMNDVKDFSDDDEWFFELQFFDEIIYNFSVFFSVDEHFSRYASYLALIYFELNFVRLLDLRLSCRPEKLNE